MVATKYGGPIDPYSPYSLHDVFEGALQDPAEDHFEWYGIHLIPQGNGTVHAQLDGHAGTVMSFDPLEDYDDVMELVDDLVGLTIREENIRHHRDEEDLIEWAGKRMTRDKEKAEAEPEKYLHIPENAATAEDYSDGE